MIWFSHCATPFPVEVGVPTVACGVAATGTVIGVFASMEAQRSRAAQRLSNLGGGDHGEDVLVVQVQVLSKWFYLNSCLF